MRQRMLKALSLAIAVITLLSTFLLLASAAVAPVINPMLDTYVVDDLVVMNYNPNNYPRDPSATHMQVIHFLEYGYSSTDLRYYGLYLYLYNPCGKEIELNGNYLQMSYGAGSQESKQVKYPLEVVSYSIDTDDKYVFYKFKVNGVNSIGRSINELKRVYNLANVEILYKGETKATTKELRNDEGTKLNKWTYMGLQKNFDTKVEAGSLAFYVDELDTIPVEMHDASWYSDTSNLGEDYRWEVKSYYFNIPISYILQYGDLFGEDPNDTDGLYAVQGEYYKYGLNGWIRLSSSTSDGFYVGYTQSTTGFVSNTKYDISYNMPLKDELYEKITSDFVLKDVLLISNGDSPDISNEDFIKLWKFFGRPVISNSSNLYMGSNTTGIGTRIDFDVTVDDDGLEDAIRTYAERDEWGDFNWLHRWINKELYTDETGYADCAPLIQINAADVNDLQEEEYLGTDLYLDYDSWLGLKEFYEEKAFELSDGVIANNVYLMRVAVEPYFCAEASNGYYYEKIIHKDTDIFSFTFQRSDGSKITVPVDCDPVDNLGSVVAGSNKDDSNPNGYPDNATPTEIINDGIKNVIEFLSSFKGAVILAAITVGSLVIFIFIVVFWKYLEPWFRRAGNLLGKVGRGLGGVFGFIGKLIFNAFKLVWNIGFTVLFYFTGLDLRISGGFDFGSKSTTSHDRYEREDMQFKRNEERRKQERHEAELRELERRSSSKSSTSSSAHVDKFADDEFANMARANAKEELNKKE